MFLSGNACKLNRNGFQILFISTFHICTVHSDAQRDFWEILEVKRREETFNESWSRFGLILREKLPLVLLRPSDYRAGW